MVNDCVLKIVAKLRIIQHLYDTVYSTLCVWSVRREQMQPIPAKPEKNVEQYFSHWWHIILQAHTHSHILHITVHSHEGSGKTNLRKWMDSEAVANAWELRKSRIEGGGKASWKTLRRETGGGLSTVIPVECNLAIVSQTNHQPFP